jgi:hypothetical protein
MGLALKTSRKSFVSGAKLCDAPVIDASRIHNPQVWGQAARLMLAARGDAYREVIGAV